MSSCQVSIRVVLERRAALDPGIVDQDVDGTLLGLDPLDGVDDRSVIDNIKGRD